jgi:hypothetical protein
VADVAPETRTTIGAGGSLLSYNGCSHNTQDPHGSDANFCCDKDNQCWTSLQECMPPTAPAIPAADPARVLATDVVAVCDVIRDY